MLFKYMLFSLAAVATAAGASKQQTSGLPERLAQQKECTSIDIRNECNKLHLLDNCTVVTGYVMITLMTNSATQQCNYSQYSYPKLREITDFMIFTEVRGLVSVKGMFPNLTVIRGRHLFLNYALGITNMPDLELLEFPSLVAIQRGHVYIGTCPKLCQLEGINWDRLTLSPGENHIVLDTKNCSNHAECLGCSSTYCWSNFICQRFENDNVLNYGMNVQHCHSQCLGGCYNGTAADCVVCRGLSDNGVCVEQCPTDKYIMVQYQRCYTREQCVNHGHFTFGFSCVAFCPGGYKANAAYDCIPCKSNESCISVCSPEIPNKVITVYNLADAEELHGCQIINGSLIITIRNQVQEKQLAHSFSTLREIRGHLKIYRSSQLRSLQFLRHLQRIHGDPLENRHYALILYDNNQLRELWTPDVGNAQLEFATGGIFIHRNNKLCNRHILEFQQQVIHDKSFDSLQTSDQEVLCGPAKLQLFVQVPSHRTVQLSWLKSQTSVELEIVYRTVMPGHLIYEENSELEAPVCTRINWQRRLLFPSDLHDNGTHYSFQLSELQPNTRYACLVRTFGGIDLQREARSDLTYVQTKPDKPRPPKLFLSNKTDNSLTLQLAAEANSSVNYFNLTVYELADDKTYLDTRDYCKQSAYLWQDMDDGRWGTSLEDYDDCCAHQAELTDDRRFIENMRELFRCSLDAPGNCDSERSTILAQQPLLQVRLPGNSTSYVLHYLKRYRLYSLELRACNDLGCSSHVTLNERTNYTSSADLLTDLVACYLPNIQQYIVSFSEPKHPNGIILSYVIHYRHKISSTEELDSHVSCLSRHEHEAKNFQHISILNVTYNECAVRVHSMAGDVMTPYVNITSCSDQQQQLRPSSTMQSIHEPKSSTPNITTAIQGVETEVGHSHGISIFLICFLLGCLATLIWVMYKRRCWRKLPQLRHYLPVREQWLREQAEDREILVDGFERVRFQNNSNNNNTEDY